MDRQSIAQYYGQCCSCHCSFLLLPGVSYWHDGHQLLDIILVRECRSDVSVKYDQNGPWEHWGTLSWTIDDLVYVPNTAIGQAWGQFNRYFRDALTIPLSSALAHSNRNT